MDNEKLTEQAEQAEQSEQATEKSAREIALEETLDELRKTLADVQETNNRLKIQNEKLLLKMDISSNKSDDALFRIFDKYNR